MERYPIKSKGNVTAGPKTVDIALTSFKKTNLSLAEIILVNTLSGKDAAKFIVKRNIKTLAIEYS